MPAPNARGVPMVIFVGVASVVSFLAITLSLFFVSRHYSRAAVTDLEIMLRERLPLDVSEALQEKLHLVPRFMETTLNLAEGRSVDLQTWEGQLVMRDVFVSYLRTFPGESRCCSAFLTIPKEANGLVTPGPNNNFSIWNVVLLRPDGIDWWYNRTVNGPLLSICSWDLATATATERATMPESDLSELIVPWFSPDPTSTTPTYTPAIIWMLDEVQLKVHATVPLHHPVTKDWIGTYVAGYKLGYLSSFLAEKLSTMPSWTMFLVDAAPINNGMLLATSIHRYEVLSCFTAARCATENGTNCNVCGPGETTSKVQAVNTNSSLVRGIAWGVAPDNEWAPLVMTTKSLTFHVDGTEYLVSTWGITSNGLTWVGVVAVPSSEIFGTLDKGERITTGIASGLIVLGVFVLLFITVSITRPLRVLSTKLWEVSHMELDTETDLAKEYVLAGVIREFATCSASFNVMVKQLKEYRSFMPQSILQTSDEESDDATETTQKNSVSRVSTGTSKITAGAAKGKTSHHLAIGSITQGHYTIMSVSFPPIPAGAGKDHQEITSRARQYVSVITDACQETRGVAEFADGLNVIVTWGIGVKCSTSEQRACEAALYISRALPDVVIGICSGKGLVGTLGTDTMRKVAAVGSIYNEVVTSRELNTHLGTKILVDERTQRGSHYHFALNPIEIVLDSASKRRMVFTLLGKKGTENQEWMYQMEANNNDDGTCRLWEAFLASKPPYPSILTAIEREDTTKDISLKRLKELLISADGSRYYVSLQLARGTLDEPDVTSDV
eukprot:TRINITY_DN6627_c0_g1_i2.p1 TRINITY_DN6627_c0_g1~~TRINITY_DN6627_c0_g1_i2.p1  ORF type:complete len:784 (+),score=178.34 TRINITY_DN6627_c0_g1_i2:65-2416(+)